MRCLLLLLTLAACFVAADFSVYENDDYAFWLYRPANYDPYPGLCIFRHRKSGAAYVGIFDSQASVVNGPVLALGSPFAPAGRAMLEQWCESMPLYPARLAPASSELTALLAASSWQAKANYFHAHAGVFFALVFKPITRDAAGFVGYSLPDSQMTSHETSRVFMQADSFNAQMQPNGMAIIIGKGDGILTIGSYDAGHCQASIRLYPNEQHSYYVKNKCSGPLSSLQLEVVKQTAMQQPAATDYASCADKLRFAHAMLGQSASHATRAYLAGNFQCVGRMEFGVPHGEAACYDRTGNRLFGGIYVFGHPADPMIQAGPGPGDDVTFYGAIKNSRELTRKLNAIRYGDKPASSEPAAGQPPAQLGQQGVQDAAASSTAVANLSMLTDQMLDLVSQIKSS